jgi:hypothetical protein
MASRPGGGSIRTEPKTPSMKGRDHLSGGGGTLPVVTSSPRGLMVDLGDGKLPGWAVSGIADVWGSGHRDVLCGSA